VIEDADRTAASGDPIVGQQIHGDPALVVQLQVAQLRPMRAPRRVSSAGAIVASRFGAMFQ